VVKDNSGSYVAVVKKPIIDDEENLVTLQVANYLGTLEETMTTLLYVLSAATLLILVPTIAASNALSRFILQPIKAIVDTMKENRNIVIFRIDLNMSCMRWKVPLMI